MIVGIDVHRNPSRVCVTDRNGREVRDRNVVEDRRVLAEELSGESGSMDRARQ